MELKLIDVSTWQPGINWEKVKPQIDGAILRAGYGGDYPGQQDDTFEYNAKECTRLGIPFGVYHYSYADTEEKARSEAAHILRLIKPFQLSYPVYLDCEEERDSIRSFAARACEIVGEIIEGAGYWFGVYANLNWFEHCLTDPKLDRFTKWVAQYNDCCQYQKPFDIWQYSSTGAIDGIGGDVDLNLCYRDFPAEITDANQAPVAPETPSSFAPYTVRVTPSNGLNCRSGAGTGYPVTTAYPCGTILAITAEKDGWGKTDQGWVCLDYTQKGSGAYSVRVTPAIGLNCRSGPGADYPIIKSYPQGTTLTISAEQNGWGRTNDGWVCLIYTEHI